MWPNRHSMHDIKTLCNSAPSVLLNIHTYLIFFSIGTSTGKACCVEVFNIDTRIACFFLLYGFRILDIVERHSIATLHVHELN